MSVVKRIYADPQLAQFLGKGNVGEFFETLAKNVKNEIEHQEDKELISDKNLKTALQVTKLGYDQYNKYNAKKN